MLRAMKMPVYCHIALLLAIWPCQGAFAQLYVSVSVATPLTPADTRMGLSLAGGIEYGIGDVVVLRPELSHSRFTLDTQDRSGNSLKRATNVTLANLHVLASGQYRDNLRLYAGPSAGVGFTSVIEEETVFTSESTDLAPTLGLTAGFTILFGEEGAWGLMLEIQLLNAFPVFWGDPSIYWTPIRLGVIL